MGSVRVGHGTHVGRVREINEDNYLSAPDLGLWVVADGMGGHAGGEVASQIVVDFIRDTVAHGANLISALQQAHKVVLLAAEEHLGMPGMGSTVVAVRVDGDDYEIAWVGDSRVYLYDDGILEQLTRDHSYVQQMIDAGEMTETEAQWHPYRNVITQALGASDLEEIEVGYYRETFYRGQQLLLCSDGLTGELSDVEIRECLKGGADEQQIVDQLIHAALEHGGADNIAVLLLTAPEDAPLKPVDDPTTPVKLDRAY